MDFFDLRSDTFYYFVRDSVTLCVLHCVYVLVGGTGSLGCFELINFRTCMHVVTVVRVNLVIMTSVHSEIRFMETLNI